MSFFSALSKGLGRVGKFLGIGLNALGFIAQSVTIVEAFSSAKGKDKQDQAVDMVQFFLSSFEGAVGRDLLNDGDVQAAVRAVIDAVVAFQNIVARKQ